MSPFRQAEAPEDDIGGGYQERPADPQCPEQALRRLIAAFEGALELPFARPQAVNLLTFSDVTTYFTQNYPSQPGVSTGALLSTHHPKGRLIFQVFLDDDGQICMSPAGTPYGRRLLVRKLDTELTERFAGKDMLTFQ